MCGGPSYSPPPPDPAAEAEKAARAEQIATAKEREQAERSEEKKRRMEEAVSTSSGTTGVRSLISGQRGGAGFGRGLLG
jgi:hypothetical protein